MSGLWKILSNTHKRNRSYDDDSAHIFTVTSGKSHKYQFISALDEAPYLTDVANDPLYVKSQIIQDFDILLRGCSHFHHFIEFLEAYDVDHYAECWLACDKFRAISKSLKIRNSNDDFNKINTPSCSLSSNDTNVDSSCVVRSLPDLVSNISNTLPVTPLPSPEESNASLNEKLSQNKKISESSSQNPISSESAVAESTLLVSNYQGNRLNDNIEKRVHGLAFEVYHKYIDFDGPKLLDLPEPLRENVSCKLDCEETDCNTFLSIQEYIYTYLEKEYFPKYLESEYFLKQKIEVFTSLEVSLHDILSCDFAIPYFMEYMEQEEAQSLLEFWMSIFNFKEHLLAQMQDDLYNAEEAQTDAMILYDKYFSLQATHKLGFSDKVRSVVECSICQEGGTSVHCFDVPLKIGLMIIQRDYMPGYLSSSLHIKFVSELINTMRITTKGRKRTASGSTCLSEESKSSNMDLSRASSTISRKNTLLAMDSSSSGNKLLKNIEDPTLALRIDSLQILDPDSLWRRKNFTKLSCGYVDELGRFESDLQPEPGYKRESRISKTLRKFVKLEENKVKEDMAYKIAEMIIKDVTNVTLGSEYAPVLRGKRPRPVSCTLGNLNALECPPSNGVPRSSSEVHDLHLAHSFGLSDS